MTTNHINISLFNIIAKKAVVKAPPKKVAKKVSKKVAPKKVAKKAAKKATKKTKKAAPKKKWATLGWSFYNEPLFVWAILNLIIIISFQTNKFVNLKNITVFNLHLSIKFNHIALFNKRNIKEYINSQILIKLLHNYKIFRKYLLNIKLL